MSLIEFNRARVAQYAERKGISLADARAKIFQLYGLQCDQEAVAVEIDPLVDEHLRWANRPGVSASAT